MRDPMSGSSTVDIIGNHTTEQKSYTIIVTSDKELETNLKEANNPQSTSLLTCTIDDPDAALETQELEEEMPVGQKQSDELPAVMEGADDVPGDSPINKAQ